MNYRTVDEEKIGKMRTGNGLKGWRRIGRMRTRNGLRTWKRSKLEEKNSERRGNVRWNFDSAHKDVQWTYSQAHTSSCSGDTSNLKFQLGCNFSQVEKVPVDLPIDEVRRSPEERSP